MISQIGIRTARKTIFICHRCKDIITKKYYYEKVENTILRYCLRCGKMKLIKEIYYDKNVGKLYGIERQV